MIKFAVVVCLFAIVSIETLAKITDTIHSKESTRKNYCNFTDTPRRTYDVLDFFQCIDGIASDALDRQGQSPGKSYWNELSPFLALFADPQLATSSFPSSTPGIGINLYNALSSISRHDDKSCVHRIICELASGEVPGGSERKQTWGSFADIGIDAFKQWLFRIDLGPDSPLLNFMRAAVIGRIYKGDSSICYKIFSRCPREPDQLVDYLNNHNGGFFQFFNKYGTGSQSRVTYTSEKSRQRAEFPIFAARESERAGANDVRYDTVIARDHEKFFPDEDGRKSAAGKVVVFPAEENLNDQQSLNRISKFSSDSHASDARVFPRENPSFFAQETKDQELDAVHPFHFSEQSKLRFPTQFPKYRLHFPEGRRGGGSTFIFPDGQKVEINPRISRFFSNDFKKPESDVRRTINFESFDVVNFTDAFTSDKSRSSLRATHPCDVICHDFKGASVHFNQIALESGKLRTLMAPDRPILDFSERIPCEIICLDTAGNRIQLSTTLSQVLRSNYSPDRASGNIDGGESSSQRPTLAKRDYTPVRVKRDKGVKSRMTRVAISPYGSEKFHSNFRRDQPWRAAGNDPTNEEFEDSLLKLLSAIFHSQIRQLIVPRNLAELLNAVFRLSENISLNAAVSTVFPTYSSSNKKNMYHRMLIMCGNVLYLIPFRFPFKMPMCVVAMETESKRSYSRKPTEFDSNSTAIERITEIPGNGTTVTFTPATSVDSNTTTSNVTCPPGELWSAETKSCVSMKPENHTETESSATAQPSPKPSRSSDKKKRKEKRKKKKKKKNVIKKNK